MLLSVITVCYNAEKVIGRTIASVLAQSADYFEYIIVDGASTDRTMEIVASYQARFLQRGIRLVVVSEKDRGIYDAMNKGVRLSSGEWLNFMNAGDRFKCPTTLEKLREPLTKGDADVVYGSTIMLRGGMMRPSAPLPLDRFARKQPICHQSTFIRASLLKEHPYDERYRVGGDYDFLLWAYTRGARYRQVDECVALFQNGGCADSHRAVMMLERARTQYKYGFIRLRRFVRLTARSRTEQIREAFRSKAKKQQLDDRIAAREKGWVISEYED
jgi:glycosyltransferase involved in cell wall biosynthesis